MVDLAAIKRARVRIGADPMGGASVDYWAAIAEHYDLDLTVVNPQVDATFRFMTLDTDGKDSDGLLLAGGHGLAHCQPRAL